MGCFIEGVRKYPFWFGAITAAIWTGSCVVGNANALNNAFDGFVDEIRIWNIARTESEIQSAMNSEFSTPLPARLVAYWKLNASGSDEVASHDLTSVGEVSLVAPGQIGFCADICNQSVCPPPPAPATPSPCSASDGSNANVTVSWTDVSNETGYHVYRDGVEVATPSSNATMFTDVPSPGTYSYCVEAFNESG